MVPFLHLPFRSPRSHPCQLCTIANLCALQKEDLGVCLLQKGKGEGRLMVIFDRLVVFFEDALFEQVVVEAGRRRVPQHLPLHNAWDIGVHISVLPPKWCFLASPRRVQKSPRDFSDTRRHTQQTASITEDLLLFLKRFMCFWPLHMTCIDALHC